MEISTFFSNHVTFYNILKSRGLSRIEKNTPLWRLKLSDLEYEQLKKTICSHIYNLEEYGMEAALCYAEWWRRDYRGNIPSKEDVAIGVGLSEKYGDDLYKVARTALKNCSYTFIKSNKGIEYFRTLLNLGGLPVNYIKKSDSIGNFSRFLRGLVRELSFINYDWNNIDSSIINQFNCSAYLGKSFRNENIYDVAMQIAHAIIMEDNSLLPYDDSDESLRELTESLKNEYSKAKNEEKIRPLSLHWSLQTTKEDVGYLLINLDLVKDISSRSIPGLNISTCYSFDIFVAGKLVGKYVRKSINRDDNGEIVSATYTRISVGLSKDIIWNGEPVVEVKLRCDNEDRIFLTVSGSYPPNFEYPQVFQMLDDHLYCKKNTVNNEKNIAIYSGLWKTVNSSKIKIAQYELYYEEFSSELLLKNSFTREIFKVTNKISQYTAEFSGNYIDWIEKSNYKLLSKVPTIRVYDNEKNIVTNVRKTYRIREHFSDSWYPLNSATILPTGIIDIKVEFPDNSRAIETFYSIGNLAFMSSNERVFSTEITCLGEPLMQKSIEQIEGITITKTDYNKWLIERNSNSNYCPSVCCFKFNKVNNPQLRIWIAIPFDGITITDINGEVVPNGKIISFSNLAHYNIISHGKKGNIIDVSYKSSKIEDISDVKHLNSNLISGIVSLSDYSELITRMFNLYGANSFDRTASVVLNIAGKEIFVRKFVLETTLFAEKIVVVDSRTKKTSNFKYEGDIFAIPVDKDVAFDDFSPRRLERVDDSYNFFGFQDDFSNNEVIVFSGPEVSHRIIPKYYNREEDDFSYEERNLLASKNINDWRASLNADDIINGNQWRLACKAFEICSKYNLPFKTFNSIKSLSNSPKLIANFIISMWLNGYSEVLVQDIDRFEQEMVIALHWVNPTIWGECINALLDGIQEPLKPFFLRKMDSFIELLQNLFNSTISTDIASEFVAFITQGKIGKTSSFTTADINSYKMKIIGLTDTNNDLPLIKFKLQGNYYPQHSMRAQYRVMIETAMCAAENTCGLTNSINLLSTESRELAMIVNFYRKYYKETYSEIFLKAVKLINHKK